MQVRPSGLAIGPLLLAFAVGCSQKPLPPPPARVTLVQKGPASVELLPLEGQPPYCLVFTVAERGPIRHLTLLEDKRSPDCPAGTPILGTAFRIPPREGKVKIYVIFSDRFLESDSIAQQMNDLVSQKQAITAMDLRAPGSVVLETLEFTPTKP
ncbi:hypothetical protein [Polyangium aurulentum]|uniref:hypothetical protein n=1 Tax=Polyangium aurulentum TaxID=2567896 RepID=UPI0010AECD08|nr:hypothetical protein [Polyangium aurulentum]UQA54619.1 hypothetical protein E8A73_024925 [Polyangium aurulentum]